MTMNMRKDITERKESRLKVVIDPAYAAVIEEMYEVTEKNRAMVKRLDAHVHLFNRAAMEGRLTDIMFDRFYAHLKILCWGEGHA